MKRQPKKEVIIKIALIGKQNVGKSALFRRFIDGSFSPDRQEITIGAAFGCLEVPSKDGEAMIKTNVWDTAGMERFRSMLPMYTRGSTVIFVCFDHPKIEDIEDQIRLARAYSGVDESTRIVLVQTKTDMAPSFNPEYVTELNEALEKYAKSNDYKLYKTSAKMNTGVKELFENEIEAGYILKKSTVRDSYSYSHGGAYGGASIDGFAGPPPPYTPKGNEGTKATYTGAGLYEYLGQNPCCNVM